MSNMQSPISRALFVMTGVFTLGSSIPGQLTSAHAESLNAKTGAWEMTHTTISTGTLIPPDVLAKMPPDRRTQIEESMKARSGKPTTFSTKECITKDDLDQNRMIKDNEDEEEGVQCTTKVTVKSAGKLVMDRTCPAPRSSTSHITFEAQTPEAVTGVIDITRPGSGKVHVDIKGRWLSASCQGIKD